MRTLLILVVLLLTPRVVIADVGAGVVVTGDASLQSQLAAHFETWVREHGHNVVPSPLPDDAIRSMVECFKVEDKEDRCARAIVDTRARAEILIFATISTAPSGDGKRNVTLKAYWFEKGRDAFADQRICERCTDGSLSTEANALLDALAKAGQHATGTIRLSSTPPGAKVLIAGGAVGVTPLDYDLAAGDHQITLTLDQHAIETRQVAVRAGETTTLDVSFVPTRPETNSKASGVRPLPLVLVVGGLAAIGTGVTLIAIDEDEGPTAPLQIRDTAPAGVAFAAAGGVALAAGLWIWSRKSSSTPVASASRGGGYIGWFSRF